MRNYNLEMKDGNERKYMYSFDEGVIHGYMIKAFSPFFRKGNVLELGSFKGSFTERLAKIFDDITCIEASEEAIEEAKQKKFTNVKLICSSFQEAEINEKFDNIILTHVLEHIDDRIDFLKKVKDNWLSENGYLFIACPNANAPSRQIAVKMGLIENNTSITDAEYKHGHRITYNLDLLEGEIKKSGLYIEHSSGIFFKALANFQWDELLKTDIISQAYLDGAYELGKIYPDLCSSIYCVCSK